MYCLSPGSIQKGYFAKNELASTLLQVFNKMLWQFIFETDFWVRPLIKVGFEGSTLFPCGFYFFYFYPPYRNLTSVKL